MDVEIINQPIRFRLHGLSSRVENSAYGQVGCRLMDEMWRIVKHASLKTTGINHWVYFADVRMFVGVELIGTGQSIPDPLELLEFELARYAKHLHVGLYQELPQKWQAVKSELAARGERITMPSLEVYGHSCESADPSLAETTILIGLGLPAT
jgi:predicted transcriptional regulator YdeE